MSRVIKFRAWDGNKMINNVSIVNGQHWSLLEDCPTGNDLMQFTGLKDKNGKDIFECDVVRFLNGETTSSESGMECDEFNTDGAIFWDDELAQWDISHRIDVSREDVFIDISEYEVIGNIYANSELLK